MINFDQLFFFSRKITPSPTFLLSSTLFPTLWNAYHDIVSSSIESSRSTILILTMNLEKKNLTRFVLPETKN